MKIALLGYGKMGKAVEEDAIRNGHEIILRHNTASTQPLTPGLLKTADVVIEFSTPLVVMDHIYACLDAGIPIVVGTTGWYEQLSLVVEDVLCRNASLFYAANFSIGVNIFFQLNDMLADLMNDFPEYEVAIDEVHHIQKKDSPSGTAIVLAEGILRFMERKQGWENNLSIRSPDKQPDLPPPGSEDTAQHEVSDVSPISIQSFREGNVSGIHTVRYYGENDRITLTHEALNRKGFAQGAVLAAEWLVGKPGVFNMRDLLGFVHERLERR